MLRIGVFLAASPYDGGAFQYGQCVLHALTVDAPEDTSATIFYTHEAWRNQAEAVSADTRFVNPSAADQLLIKCLKSRILPSKSFRRTGFPMLGIANQLLAADCDLWIFPNQDVWSYCLPVRSLVSVFDLMHRYEPSFPEVSRSLKYFRRESHYRQLCSSAAGVLVDSEVGKQQVIESYGTDPERVHVLPFVPPPRPEAEPSASLADLPDRFFFYPAQFWAHKNHLRLLEALARLKKKHANVRLILAGSKKNNYAEVEKAIERLDLAANVRILGYVSDAVVAQLYSQARALVMPTFFGPTNIPPLEAMQYGCPVAVSGIYAMPEQLGSAALYFDPGSVSEIAAVLDRLWTDDALCADLADKGRARFDIWQQPQFSARLWTTIRSTVARSRP